MSVHHIQRQSFVRKVSAGETIGDYSDPQFVRDMSIEMVHQSRAEEAANFQDGSSVNACLPGSKPSLARSQLPLLSLLVSCIVSSSLPTFCDSIVGSPSPDEQIILRRKVASVVDDILVRLPERGVDVSVARVGGSLRPHILGALLSEIDDPESHLPPESSLVVALDGGVNIGYHSTIVTTGLYPPFSAKLSPDEPLKLVWSTTNYKSAEGDLAPLVDEVLRDEVSSGFLLPVTESQVQHVCRLAAIPKNGCSGPTVRLISDHRRSGLNGLLSCDESCALPYLRDLLLLLHPITVTGHSLTSIQLDISHAFRTIRVSPRDVPLLGVHHKDSFYLDLALPFGLRSSPYWWNRLSSTIHRVMSVFVRLSDLSQSVREGGLTYVDDVSYFTEFESRSGVILAQLCVLWTLLGCDVAYHKVVVSRFSIPGTVTKVLGFSLSRGICGRILLEIPQEKLDLVSSQLHDLLIAHEVSSSSLSKLCGRLQWMSQLAPFIRPFLACFYGASAVAQRRNLHYFPVSSKSSLRSSAQQISCYISDSQIYRFISVIGGSCVSFNPTVITCDASTSFVAGFIICNSQCVYKFRFNILDLPLLLRATLLRDASAPSSRDISRLEALAAGIALLQAVALVDSVVCPIIIRSDNIGIVHMLRKCYSRDSALHPLFKLLAMEVFSRKVYVFHIRTHDNILADKLSRGCSWDFGLEVNVCPIIERIFSVYTSSS